MNTKEIIELEKEYIMQTYKRFPVCFVKGKDFKLWDINGKEYVDMFGGLAVANVGHCNYKVVCAIRNQARKLIHVSNLYYTLPQIKLAKMLSEISFSGKCFFANSGAEANEAAIKLARKYSKVKFGNNRFNIITMRGSFHGRTLATVTATAQEKFHKDFEPLMQGFKYVPFNDIEAVKNAIDNTICAIMVEPIQGEGGINIPKDNYLIELKKLCDENKLLLILDEVQTGFGRTGKMFAYQHYNIEPDIMSLAKALGGGLSIGAIIAKKEVADVFDYGTHASTFGGNPVACSAGIAVIKIIKNEKLINNAEILGEYLLNKLLDLKKKYAVSIVDVRGKGFMLGVELNFPGNEIVDECLKRGLVINCTVDKVLRFLPPLTITKRYIDKSIKILDGVLNEKKFNKII